MKAKDRAYELVAKYSDKACECNEGTEWDYDKQCALICVDEILNSHIDSVYETYYLEVKQEIIKL